MVASRFSLSAVLLAIVGALISCQGLAAVPGLGASDGLVKGAIAAGGLAKGVAPVAAVATGLAKGALASGPASKGALGGLLGKKEGESSLVVPTTSQDKTEVKPSSDISKKQSEGFLGTNSPTELFKLLINPFDLVARIAEHFELHLDKFFPLVKKGINFGFELAVQPLVLSLKIIEKVFVPDHCKLKFACELTRKVAWLRDILPKLSDKVLSQSKIFKALSDGIHNDCHTIYACHGHPKLKDEYKEHHKDHHDHGHKQEGHGNDYHPEGHHEGHHDEEHGEEHHEPEWSASTLSKSVGEKKSN